MQQNYPFQPGTSVSNLGASANTTSVAVVATNTTFALSPSVGSDGGTIRVANIGTQTIFLAYGTAMANLTTSMPILGNTVETFSLPGGVNSLSVIAAGVGSTVYVTPGIGQ